MTTDNFLVQIFLGVFSICCEIIAMFNSRPFVGRDKLDTAGVTVGCLELALVTRVAIDGDAALTMDD